MPLSTEDKSLLLHSNTETEGQIQMNLDVLKGKSQSEKES